MPSLNGFGYHPYITVFETGYGASLISPHIANDDEIPPTLPDTNATTGMYFASSDFDSNSFTNANYLQSKNTSDKYKYTITKTDASTTIKLFNASDVEVESVVIYTNNDNGNLDFYNMNLCLRCSYADEENPTITQCGVAIQVGGVGEYGPVGYYAVAWFTSADALTIIQDCVTINKEYGSQGTVVTRLKNSDNFIITKMPSSVYSKNVVNQDHQLYNDFIPINEDFDDIALNSYYVYPHTTYTSYWGSNVYASPFSVHTAFLDFYKNDVGSDLMRKTSNDEFTNAGDLSTFNDITIKNGGESDLFKINFSGGYAQWRYDNNAGLGISAYVLDFYDDNDTLLDSWRVNGNYSSPSSQDMMSSHYARYINVSTAFLCKEGSNFYIVGNIQCLYVFDADGNRLPANGYLGAGYCVLKKLNSSISNVLNDATETIIEFDKQDVDDTSDVGSTPQNANELNDRISTWDAGENQGENTGIRHNGSDIIDASNGEITGDHPVGEISTPKESGEGRIPTPLNTGTITAFAPDVDELKSFFRVCNQQSVLETFANLFQQPLEKVVSCHTCIAPALISGTRSYLTFGAWSSSSYGNLSMLTLEQQYYSCYMGFITLEEKRNSYKDYPPFCNYKIYLPYIGVRDIDGRIVVGKKLELWYHIDVLTGDILAELKVANMNSQIKSSFYCWQGNTLVPMPLKSTDYSSVITNSIGTILSTGTAIASGVANSARTVQGFTETAKTLSDSFFPDIRSIGTVQGSMTYCMYPYPYIIKEYPYLSETNPYNYKRLVGLPSNIGNKLSDNLIENSPQFIKFYAQDLNLIHTGKKNLYASESEKRELETLLAEGVYI